MKNKTMFLMAVVSMLAGVQANAAILACKPGPICDKLHQAVSEVKATKVKRHKDVQQYGRLSAEVKADDHALASATQGDREIRAERKAQRKKPTPVVPGKGKRQARLERGKRGRPHNPVGPKSV
jgi:hypothetical protein